MHADDCDCISSDLGLDRGPRCDAAALAAECRGNPDPATWPPSALRIARERILACPKPGEPIPRDWPDAECCFCGRAINEDDEVDPLNNCPSYIVLDGRGGFLLCRRRCEGFVLAVLRASFLAVADGLPPLTTSALVGPGLDDDCDEDVTEKNAYCEGCETYGHLDIAECDCCGNSECAQCRALCCGDLIECSECGEVCEEHTAGMCFDCGSEADFEDDEDFEDDDCDEEDDDE